MQLDLRYFISVNINNNNNNKHNLNLTVHYILFPNSHVEDDIVHLREILKIMCLA